MNTVLSTVFMMLYEVLIKLFVSGGKDSCYNMMCCVAEGHSVVALANLRPSQKGWGLLFRLFLINFIDFRRIGQLHVSNSWTPSS